MTERKLKQKTCKVKGCEGTYLQYNSIVNWCSPACGAKLALEKLEKKKAKAVQTRKRENYAAKKEFLENDKKHVTKQARAYCHRWIRWRDLERDGKTNCMACQKPMSHLPSRAIHAMHFRASGQNSAIRYHEDNLRIGCYSCNSANGGNLTDYETHLTAEIGVERVDYLKSQNQVKTWTLEELREVRDDYGSRLKALGLPLPSIGK